MFGNVPRTGLGGFGEIACAPSYASGAERMGRMNVDAGALAEIVAASIDPDTDSIIDVRSLDLDGDARDELTRVLRSHGVHVVQLKAGSHPSDREIISALDVGFSFPSYFGDNWDAVNECLLHLDQWLDARAFACVVTGTARFEEQNREALGILRDLFSDAAQYWREDADVSPIAFKLVLT